ncbi:MAG: lipopolysaccharide biosynthesis protein [Bacteroidota bacterium]
MKHYIWSFLNTILARGFSFIFSIILGNILLPRDLGLYVTVILVISCFANILSLNAGSGIVQKLNDRSEQAYRFNYFTAGLLYILMFSLIGVLLFLSLKGFITQIFDIPETSYLLNLAVILIPITMLRSYFLHVLQSEMEFNKLTGRS